MKDYREIVKFIQKSNTIVTSKDFKDKKISYYYINKLIKDNYIKRISTGIYGKTDSFDDEYYVFQQRYKKSVFSYNTALFMLGITEVTPDKVDITVSREYNVHSLEDKVRVHYINKKYLNMGTTVVKSPFGNDVISYNIERTICDIVKNENSLDKEQTNKIIRTCFADNKINGTMLIEFAKKLKCERKIKAIMEVLI